MELRIKRIYSEGSPDDGQRVLVDRLWPRGLTKERADLDLWAKDLAPSSQARKEFGHRPENFEIFKHRYIDELDHRQAAQDLIEKLAEENPWRITLLYAAKDKEYNHATVLLDYLHEHLPQSSIANPSSV